MGREAWVLGGIHVAREREEGGVPKAMMALQPAMELFHTQLMPISSMRSRGLSQCPHGGRKPEKEGT